MPGQFQIPADSWVTLCPFGEFPHPDSGLVQIIDQRAADNLEASFARDAAKPGFAGLLLDYDHFSYDTTQSSEAAGWITGIRSRENQIEIQVRWSSSGRQAVEDGKYRFLSPTWLPSEVERLPQNRIRPIRLDSAGLTNNPNIKTATPISNRGGLKPQTPTKDSGMNDDQKAADQLANRARSLMQEHGWDFTRAWDVATGENPDLVAIANRAQSAKIQNRSSRHEGSAKIPVESSRREQLAADRVLVIANRLMKSNGWEFERAWDAALDEDAGARAIINRAQAERLGKPLSNSQDARGRTNPPSTTTAAIDNEIEAAKSDLLDQQIKAFLERFEQLRVELGAYWMAWRQIATFETWLMPEIPSIDADGRIVMKNRSEVEAFIEARDSMEIWERAFIGFLKRLEQLQSQLGTYWEAWKELRDHESKSFPFLLHSELSRLHGYPPPYVQPLKPV